MCVGRKSQYCQNVGSQVDLYDQRNPVKNPASCLVDIDKLIAKFTRRGERPRRASTGLEEEKKAGGRMVLLN